jgi:hypothetical protein
MGRTAGTVGRVLALRVNAFEAELAGIGEDGRAVAFQMLVEAQKIAPASDCRAIAIYEYTPLKSCDAQAR